MEDERTRAAGVSRRGLLRGVGAAGAGAVGLAALGRPAAASNCPRSAGYWANHEWPGGLSELTVGGRTMSAAEWRGFLLDPPRGDAADSVARELVAARLNFWTRPPSDPDCVYRELEHLDGRSVHDVVGLARRWLAAASFDEPGPQRDWTVAVVVDGERRPVDGKRLRDTLARFNRGRLFQLDCGCDDRERPTAPTDDHERPPPPSPDRTGSGDAGEDGPASHRPGRAFRPR